MAIAQRNLLGSDRPYDNHQPSPATTPGNQPQPTGRTDQTSPETADRAAQNVAAFREAQRVSGATSFAGATGQQLGRGEDSAVLSNPAGLYGDGTGAAVVAANGPVLLRSEGGDSGVDGTGKTVG
jgi:hypothetical protein